MRAKFFFQVCLDQQVIDLRMPSYNSGCSSTMFSDSSKDIMFNKKSLSEGANNPFQRLMGIASGHGYSLRSCVYPIA
ncbi:hypothetical protein SUGI_0959710 [Cryptomeria japonica]|nr:hypothetical protein SUGI_0959710 [Cryptomeria japonica]